MKCWVKVTPVYWIWSLYWCSELCVVSLVSSENEETSDTVYNSTSCHPAICVHHNTPTNSQHQWLNNQRPLTTCDPTIHDLSPPMTQQSTTSHHLWALQIVTSSYTITQGNTRPQWWSHHQLWWLDIEPASAAGAYLTRHSWRTEASLCNWPTTSIENRGFRPKLIIRGGLEKETGFSGEGKVAVQRERSH